MPNRKPKLNILAKSLFLGFYPKVTINRWTLTELLKATIISKEFISAARFRDVYSFYTFTENIERENLETIEGYRKVWAELLPDVKFRMHFSDVFEVSSAVSVLQEVGSRVYYLECSANLLVAASQLDLNECVLNTALNVEQLPHVLRTQRIKKLSCVLTKMKKETTLFSPHLLDNFPPVPTLRQLKIGCQTEEEKIDNLLREVGPFLSCFQHLDYLLLEFVFVKHPYDPFTLQQITQMMNDAIDSAKALRDELFAKRPHLKMEAEHEEWVKDVKSHRELAEAVPLGSNESYSILAGIIKPTYDLYSYDGHHHTVAMKWRSQNFVGKIKMSIQEWNDAEWAIEESEDE